jgi:proline iminopeptidase
MQTLFPEIKPYARHRLQVDARHNLYIDESGSATGLPVVFLHGGPGSGCEFDSRRFFDPAVYRIILVDQRGSGRSTPQGETEDNTLQNLIADLEQIRELLAVPAWVAFGGGWGSTLALAYAEHYPERVLGLILRGVFLGRPADIDWIYKNGANAFFPEHWADFMAPILGMDPTAPPSSKLVKKL